jgi:hypothetical protein
VDSALFPNWKLRRLEIFALIAIVQVVVEESFHLLFKVSRIDIKSLISDDSLLPLETFSIVRFQSIATE